MGKILTLKETTANCKCGTWLDHWKKHSGGIEPKYCVVSSPDCLNKDLVGAHVKKIDPLDKATYIVPLCQHHSQGNQELEISDFYPLVPATQKGCSN